MRIPYSVHIAYTYASRYRIQLEYLSKSKSLGVFIVLTRMSANAQRGGRPTEYRWRPLFNAAKFG